MSETRLDVLSPANMGEDRISIGVDERSRVIAQQPITLRVDYARAKSDGGVMLPLLFSVQPEFGDGATYFEKSYDRFRPGTITFTVAEPGSYLITLRETAHNRWQGRLRLDIGGEGAIKPAKVVRAARDVGSVVAHRPNVSAPATAPSRSAAGTPATRLDVLSPAYMGEDRISLGVDERSRVMATQPITLRADYERANEGGGVVLPLLLSVQPEFGDGEHYQEKLYSRFKPSTITLSVPVPGSYLVTLREQAHNRWQGRLRLDVAGEGGARPSKVVRGQARASTSAANAAAGTSTAGLRGAVGPAGADGAQGPAGAAGADGADGAAGAAGADGATGPAGAAGATGATGPTGARGATGVTGATGPQGAQGATGPAQGPSGFVRHLVTDWLGTTGPTGPSGLAFPYIGGFPIRFEGELRVFNEETNGEEVNGASGLWLGMRFPSGISGWYSIHGAKSINYENVVTSGLDTDQNNWFTQNAATGLGDVMHSTAAAGYEPRYALPNNSASGTSYAPVRVAGFVVGRTGVSGSVLPLAQLLGIGPSGVMGGVAAGSWLRAEYLDGRGQQGGIAGPIGVQGVQGVTGNTGPAGPQGIQGPTGPAGSGDVFTRTTVARRFVRYDDGGVSSGFSGATGMRIPFSPRSFLDGLLIVSTRLSTTELEFAFLMPSGATGMVQMIGVPGNDAALWSKNFRTTAPLGATYLTATGTRFALGVSHQPGTVGIRGYVGGGDGTTGNIELVMRYGPAGAAGSGAVEPGSWLSSIRGPSGT